jgi:hypothetical protein
MFSFNRHVAGTTANTVRFSPVLASNEPPAETDRPSFPTPVGTKFIFAFGCSVVLHSPSPRARLLNRLSSTGLTLNGSTTHDGLATTDKSVFDANDIQLSNLQEPASEMSAASTA